MNILIPMAGEGSRFIIGGFDQPKPLIDVLGKPMIQWAVDTLGFGKDQQYIFIIKRQHIKYGLKKVLEDLYPGCKVIDIDYTTEGAACTCLLAERYIDNDEELLEANCDQIMDWNYKSFCNFKDATDYDGLVVTYYANTEKNSYVRLNSSGLAVEFAEKKIISNESLNGIHYWRYGKDFVKSAKAMIAADDRVNNEFYIAPTYNYMIKEGKKITAWHIDSKCHNAIGTPADLYYYVNRRLLYESP